MIFQKLFPFTGVASLVAILATGYFILHIGTKRYNSLSAHAAASRSQRILLFLALVVFSLPLYAWFIFWLAPAYNLPSASIILFALTFIAHILLTVFPLTQGDGKSIRNLVHLGAGATVAVSMFVLLILLLFSPVLHEHLIAWLMVLIAYIYCAGCLAWYTVAPSRRYFLRFEVVYIVVFAISMAAASIVRINLNA